MQPYQYINGCQVLRVADNVLISSNDPNDPDLLQFQEWAAEGNTPDPDSSSLWSDYQNEAVKLLTETDLVAIRCLKAGVAFPSEWLTYVNKLRAIVNTMTGDASSPLPVKPMYPTNS